MASKGSQGEGSGVGEGAAHEVSSNALPMPVLPVLLARKAPREVSLGPAIEPPEPDPQLPSEAPTELGTGGRLSPGAALTPELTIVRFLGEGGQGEVYEVIDKDGRRSAAKLLLESFERDPNIARRLEREAQLASSIQHPSVVRVHGTRRSSTGRLFVWMELLVGESLGEKLKREGPLDPKAACRIAAQIASGLAAAHSAAVVHRDLKPSNVIVTNGADGEMAKIMDFGIAKLTGALEETRLTQAGAIMGTPAYMAPEQITDPHSAGPAADQYSLGAVFYQMLTGRPPFISQDVAQMLVDHVKSTPINPKSLRPEIPQPVAALVLRTLQKRPEDRFDSAKTLALKLQTVASAHSGQPGLLDSTGVPFGQGPPVLSVRAAASIHPPTPAPPRGHPMPPSDGVPDPSVVANKIGSLLSGYSRILVGAAIGLVLVTVGAELRTRAMDEGWWGINRGSVRVTSKPEGAEVYLEDELLTDASGAPITTPTTIDRLEFDLDYEIRVAKKGQGEADEEFRILPDEPIPTIALELPGPMAEIEVKLRGFSMAQVEINGHPVAKRRRRGKEKRVIKVRPGSVTVSAAFGSGRCADSVTVMAPADSHQVIELRPDCGDHFDWRDYYYERYGGW